jgi:hypothetical protein
VEPEEWDDPSFDGVLQAFRQRFAETRSEEGTVMATALAYVLEQTASTRNLMAEYRSSQRVQTLFQHGVREREAALVKGSRSN